MTTKTEVKHTSAEIYQHQINHLLEVRGELLVNLKQVVADMNDILSFIKFDDKARKHFCTSLDYAETAIAKAEGRRS